MDFVKGLACISVVLMHCEFPGFLGVLVQSVSRYCVPFFFMVSGYFCYHSDGKKTDYLKKIRHIALIALGAVVFYLIAAPLYQPEGLSFTWKDVVLWLALNEPFYVAGALWFLFALLYDYILFAIVEKRGLRKLAYWMIPIGIAAYILCAQGAAIIGLHVPKLVYRNFLVEGFPLFTLGFWLHERQEKIQLSNKALTWIAVISTLLCPVEWLFMRREFGVNIATFPQVAALFLLCVRNPGFGAGTWLHRVGAACSMYVYIIQRAVLNLLEKAYLALGISENGVFLYAKPVIGVAVTLLCAMLIVSGQKILEKRFPGKKK